MNSKYKNFLVTQKIRIFNRIHPNQKIWIFSSAHNNKYNYNSKYLFEYVKNNLPEIKPYFVVNDDVLRLKLKERYGDEYFIETKSEDGIKKVLGAGVWFTAASMPVYGCNLGKQRLIVNLWHGVPLKKIVLMENNFPLIKKFYHKYIFAKNYTHVLTTSSKLTQIMCKSFGVSQEVVKVWGQPRNDCLFEEGNVVKRLKMALPELPKFDKLILYAPTWRGDEKVRFFQFRDFDKQKLWDFLENNKYVICIRTHIEESAIANEYLGNRVMLLNDDKVEDIMEVIMAFDLLITDWLLS